RDKVIAARKMTPSERMFAGAELFADVCDRMRAGIKMQFPDLDDQEVHARLLKRLKRLRQIEDQKIYSAH
ncbi:MAG: hypothetical protein AAF226_12760, partial [Verrucomicrobiota bacterium]